MYIIYFAGVIQPFTDWVPAGLRCNESYWLVPGTWDDDHD